MPKKRKNKTTVFFKRRNFLFTFAAISVFLIAGHYLLVAPYLETQKFQTAETEVKTIVSNIEKDYPLSNIGEEKTCDRPNLKFEEGPLSCDFYLTYRIKVETEQEAVAIASQIDSYFRSINKIEIQADQSDSLRNYPNPAKTAKTRFKEKNSGMNCVVVYDFAESADTNKSIGISCGAQVKYSKNYPG